MERGRERERFVKGIKKTGEDEEEAKTLKILKLSKEFKAFWW